MCICAILAGQWFFIHGRKQLHFIEKKRDEVYILDFVHIINRRPILKMWASFLNIIPSLSVGQIAVFFAIWLYLINPYT